MIASCRAGLAAFVAVLLALLVVPIAANAQSNGGLEVNVRGTSLAADGTTTIDLTVLGAGVDSVLDADAFTIAENGQDVGPVSVEPLTVEADAIEVTTVLALDTSTSMQGELLDNVKAGGRAMVETVTAAGIPVGLIEFNSQPSVLSAPTTDTDELLGLIDGLEATGMTALYDAVIAGVAQLQAAPGITSLIVLADGEDNNSDNTLDDAIDAAQLFDLPITVIAYETDRFEPDVLRPLADETEGRFITLDDVDQFEATFAEVADDVTNQYRVTYQGSDVDAEELEVELVVSVGGQTSERTLLLANTRSEVEVAGAPAPPPAAQLFDAGPLGTQEALWVATGIVFLALVLFLGVLFLPRGDRRAQRTLQRGIKLTERRGVDSRAGELASGASATAIAQRALEIINAAPKPEGYEDRLQVDLDRAGWQLRASEFIALRIAGFVAAGLLFWALTGRVWFGVLGALAGLYAPNLVLVNSKQRRQHAFAEQLPDTLQLLAGTLKAGYGVLQGIDTIVKEIGPPMSQEFQRVLTEARLGLPLEDSLDAMAERVGSEDFKWVVVAMNIQRQVGGNLAELLDTVATTLRGREQTRRQIRVLSAEGRLSAIILVALPFLLLFYLLLTNPTYLTPLITTAFGLFMAGGATLLMVIGVFWMQRMIKIDV